MKKILIMVMSARVVCSPKRLLIDHHWFSSIKARVLLQLSKHSTPWSSIGLSWALPFKRKKKAFIFSYFPSLIILFLHGSTSWFFLVVWKVCIVCTMSMWISFILYIVVRRMFLFLLPFWSRLFSSLFELQIGCTINLSHIKNIYKI